MINYTTYIALRTAALLYQQDVIHQVNAATDPYRVMMDIARENCIHEIEYRSPLYIEVVGLLKELLQLDMFDTLMD